MPAAYWLTIVVCGGLIVAGCVKGYNVWQDHKAKLAAIQEEAEAEAKWQQDMAEFNQMLVRINSLNDAIQKVALANTEVYIPDNRTLH